MEKRTNKTLHLSGLTKLPDVRILENYDDIELTEDELSEIIRKAKIAKKAKLNELAYLEKLRRGPEYPVFSAKQLKAYIFQKYPKFKTDQWNEAIFEALCLYFSNDPEFEDFEEGFSLEKGLMLYGPVGCGKTHLMDIFSINTKLSYTVVEALEIASDYTEKGEGFLDRYTSLCPAYAHQNFGQMLIGWCFDDVGFEDMKKRFGNNMNTIEYVLSRAYRNEMTGNIHITTNLDADQIEATYGGRVKSRMRGMFNLITFDKNSPDRRK